MIPLRGGMRGVVAPLAAAVVAAAAAVAAAATGGAVGAGHSAAPPGAPPLASPVTFGQNATTRQGGGISWGTLLTSCTRSSPVRVRREVRDLTAPAARRLAAAWLAAIADGSYGALVRAHDAWTAEAHNGSQFFPWHRAFVLGLENALRVHDASVTLPYCTFLGEGEGSTKWRSGEWVDVRALLPLVGPHPLGRRPGWLSRYWAFNLTRQLVLPGCSAPPRHPSRVMTAPMGYEQGTGRATRGSRPPLPSGPPPSWAPPAQARASSAAPFAISAAAGPDPTASAGALPLGCGGG